MLKCNEKAVMGMVREENWGISPERITQFLLAQPDVIQTSNGFSCRNCRIWLTSIPGQLMGKWPHTRSLIRVEGPESEVIEIHRHIFLQFLSAGG